MTNIMDDSFKKKIIESLEQENYTWRSIKGILKDLGDEDGLNSSEILEFLDTNEHVLSTNSKSGEKLYTTRANFSRKASRAEKFFGALKGKLA